MNRKLLFLTIDKIEKLETNWDSYNSSSISNIVCDNARWCVSILPDDLISPHICPCSGGESIQLEWYLNGKELELEIREDNISYLKVFNCRRIEESRMEEEEIKLVKDENNEKEINKLINWLINKES